MAICAECGEKNPARARYCLACGAELGVGAGPVEERKVVSILFVDLVGFTASSDRADPEDVRARIRPYHARVKREIESFGGTVEKFVGDAVMAAFGAPVAHEDDAERAVRAGLRVLDAISRLNEEMPELQLVVRAAVTTGEALVARGARPGEAFVTGDVVNTAARLQQATPPGTLAVGEKTFQTTKHAIEYRRIEPVSVKGKAEALSVWLARRARARPGETADESVVPFVGREYELAVLRETYTRTLREASVHLVTLVGEPGVGKSRLVGECRVSADAAGHPAAWRQGRCLPYGEGVTFWGLGEIVKAQAGVLESDTAEEVSAKLTAAVRAVVGEATERDWVETRLAPLVGAGTAEGSATVDRSQSFTAWRRFLEDIASRNPLVLVFEDLHWADDAMLEFVEHLLDRSAGVPLLVICTARPELYERRPDWGGGKRNSTTISLSPLNTEQTARLVGALLSQAVLPAETQAALLDRAGGNPLYAQEFVHMLYDREILARDGQHFDLRHGPEIAVPETIEALIAARLDTLTAERKTLLQAAAVMGKVFWAGAVAFVAGVDGADVEEALRELVRKELVRPVRESSVEGEHEYSFWHVLVRDVAYRQIPRPTRAASHRAVAEWIEEVGRDRLTDHAELLAHHYVSALELYRAAGTEAAELEEQTRRALVLAGERALPLDVAKADAYFRKAIELLPSEAAERPQVLEKAADAAALLGRYAEAEAEYGEAIAGFRREGGDDLRAGEALAKLAQLVRDRGATARAKALLAEAVQHLERVAPGPELVRAYTETARFHHFHGPAEECLRWADKAIRTAKQLNMEGQTVRAAAWREFTRFARGDLGALEQLKDALQMGLEHGLPEDSAAVYLGLGDIVWWTEGPAAGLEVYREGIEFTERRGMTYYAMYLKAESVWPLFELGRWDALLGATHEVVAWDRTSYQALLALPYAAHVHLLLGDAATAKSLRDDFLPRARESGDLQVLVSSLVTSALIDAFGGDSRAAVVLVEELEEATRERAVWRAQRLPDALRICAAAGATDLASSLLEGLEVTAARQRHALQTGHALLAEARGEVEHALELYSAATERWAEFGFALEEGQALLGRARCLAALHSWEEANESVQRALAIWGSLGARSLADEAAALGTANKHAGSSSRR